MVWSGKPTWKVFEADYENFLFGTSACASPAVGHALNQLANKDPAIISIISSSFDLKIICSSRKSKLRHPETEIMKSLEINSNDAKSNDKISTQRYNQPR